jgi:hypothetical protein
MPFGIGCNVAQLTESVVVCPGDQNIGRAGDKLFEDCYNLLALFSAAEDDLRKTLPLGASMIDPGETNVFEMEVFDTSGRFVQLQLA